MSETYKYDCNKIKKLINLGPTIEKIKSESSNIEIHDIVEETRKKIDSISKQVYHGEINIFDSAHEMGRLTEALLKEIANRFALFLNTKIDQLPFALFVFGATARNQMLPNSDLDISLAFKQDCPEEIKRALKEALSALPFNDEVDFAQWDSMDNIKKVNCPSLMEYNKIVESVFIAGNTEIGSEHNKIVNREDTQKDKERRFITEYGLLHRFDYQNRGTEHGSNLKYDFGASRDIIFLDWYYLLNNKEKDRAINENSSFAGLDLMEKKNIINSTENEEVKFSIELILLTKFALWSKNISEGDEKLLYLSDYSLSIVYEDIKKLLKDKGITNSTGFIQAYHKAKSRIHIAVKKASLDVLSRNQDLKEVWQIAKEKKQLDHQVLNILKNPSWDEMVPFAVKSTSPEILHYIVQKLANLKGYEYILRIISQNKYITNDIKKDLLSSRLDSRFKKRLAA